MTLFASLSNAKIDQNHQLRPETFKRGVYYGCFTEIFAAFKKLLFYRTTTDHFFLQNIPE